MEAPLDPLIYGHASDERIVSAVQLNDQNIRLYLRTEEGITSKDVPFYPFFLLTHGDYLSGFSQPHWLKELGGTNPFRHIAAFSRWSEMWEGVHQVLRSYNAAEQPRIATHHDLPVLFLRGDAVRQYLTQSGNTLFKNMPFDDIVRVQAECLVRSRPQGKSGDTGILILAAHATTGEEFVQSADEHSEKEMLESFLEWMERVDPDILEGHRIRERLLPALVDRCEYHGIQPSIGRGGRSLRIQAVIGAAGTNDPDKTTVDCFGRHIVDTIHVIDGSFATRFTHERGTLSLIERMAGIILKDGAQTPEELASLWERSPESAVRGVVRRVEGIKHVTQRMLPQFIALARMCPMSLESVLTSSVATLAEALLVRQYVRNKHSIPQPPAGANPPSSFGEIFHFGRFERIVALDLIPAISRILAKEVPLPVGDELHGLTQIATALSEAEHGDRLESNAKRSVILGLFSQLMNPKGIFHDPARASACYTEFTAEVEAYRRALDKHNAVPVVSDSEYLLVSLPDNVSGEQNETGFLQRALTPLGHEPVIIGRFPVLLTHHRRSFAVLSEANDVYIMGTSLLPRTGERFLRKFIQRCIECLLANDISMLHHTYASFRTKISKHEWDIREFVRIETAHKDMDMYLSEVSAGTRNASPAYEAARRASMYVQPGTRIAYYVSGTGPDVRLIQSCRIADEWEPGLPNENTAYYLQRLQEATGRFKDYFNPQDYERIFTLDDLFGFSPEGISIVNRPFPGENAEPEQESEQEEFGIWLADD